MRLVYFFVLSLFLHIAALVYPVSFGGQSRVEFIPVTIFPIEQESIGGQDSGDSGNPRPRASSKTAMRASPTVRGRALSKPTAMAPAPITNNPSSAPEPLSLAIEASDGYGDSRIALASVIADSPSTQGTAPMGSLVHGVNGGDTSGNESGGNGLGPAGTASGSGPGTAENGIVMIQARYRDTPRPSYPESARREGHEGRVLLRVLVDDQGRTRSVEINNSSGSAALDRAAAEAIQRWRFYPARYGDRPIESWLRIPIEFRLADAKSW